MKRLLPIFIVLTSISKSFADVHFAPEINIHYSGFSQVNAASQNVRFTPKFGLKIGANFDSAVAGKFSMHGGLFLTMKGGTHEEQGDHYSLKESVSLNYLEYPVYFGYRFITPRSGYFFAETGPFVRLGLWGKYESYTVKDGVKTDIKTTEVFYKIDDALYKMLDYGWNFGVGYMSPFGFYVRAEYGIAFANIAKKHIFKSQEHRGLWYYLWI